MYVCMRVCMFVSMHVYLGGFSKRYSLKLYKRPLISNRRNFGSRAPKLADALSFKRQEIERSLLPKSLDATSLNYFQVVCAPSNFKF